MSQLTSTLLHCANGHQRQSFCLVCMATGGERREFNTSHSCKWSGSSTGPNSVSILPQICVLPITSPFFAHCSTKEPLTSDKCELHLQQEHSRSMPNLNPHKFWTLLHNKPLYCTFTHLYYILICEYTHVCLQIFLYQPQLKNQE